MAEIQAEIARVCRLLDSDKATERKVINISYTLFLHVRLYFARCKKQIKTLCGSKGRK